MAKPKQKHTNFFPAAVGGELTRQDRRNTDGKSDRWGRIYNPKFDRWGRIYNSKWGKMYI